MKAHPGGHAWEQLAETYLRQQGLTTECRNFHCRMGEIDLIMREGDTVVFVEVRYRSRQDFGGAVATVTRQKQARMVKAAGMYLARKPGLYQRPCRFDVVSLCGTRNTPEIDWIQYAFDQNFQ